MSTTTTARLAIDQRLREDGFHYCFASLADRFFDGLAEAREYGDDTVTIKIPSASEFSVPAHLVETALA